MQWYISQMMQFKNMDKIMVNIKKGTRSLIFNCRNILRVQYYTIDFKLKKLTIRWKYINKIL
jgi:hypothetical protein